MLTSVAETEVTEVDRGDVKSDLVEGVTLVIPDVESVDETIVTGDVIMICDDVIGSSDDTSVFAGMEDITDCGENALL